MLKKHKGIIAVVLIMMCTLVLFSGCTQEAGTTDSEEANEEVQTKLDKIKEKGELVVGTSADYPPYEFHYVKDGKDEISGFDISIAKAIAEDLGVELVLEDMGFKALLPALQSNKIDMVIAGMTPTEERKENVDFSKIYYTAEQGVLLKEEDLDKVKSADDLTGKVIGVQKATIQEDIAKEQIEDAQIEALTSIKDLVLALNSNKIDVVIAELPVANAYKKNVEGLAVADFTFKDEAGGSAIATQKGNTEFVAAINKTLDKLIEEKKIDEFVVEAIKLANENSK